MLNIGQRWKAAREAAGLSAARAAEVAGLHENTIYLLENDKKNDGVTLRVCKQVADVYGVCLSEIFSTDESRETVPQELRPLVDLLQPLDVDGRVSFIRNVVSNARFMASLLSIPTPRSAEIHPSESQETYIAHQETDDEDAVVIPYDDRGRDAGQPEGSQGRPTGAARGTAHKKARKH